MAIKMLMTGALLGLLGLPQIVQAFDPHEHKYLADRGMVEALDGMANGSTLRARLTDAGFGLPLQRSRVQPTENLVQQCPDDKLSKFQPLDQEKRTSASADSTPANRSGLIWTSGKPIRVWVGGSTWGEWFTFGDLVAIYADFRKVVQCDDNAASCNLGEDTSRHEILKKHTNNWPSWIAASFGCVVTSDPECMEFLLKALKNPEHFGRTAVQSYRNHRVTALAKIVEAVLDDAPEKLWVALHYEAIALHSLTDLFASGHLVMDGSIHPDLDRPNATNTLPTTEADDGILQLAYRALFTSGGQLGIYHGRVHNYLCENGVEVLNGYEAASGPWWRAYGDGYLTAVAPGDSTRQIAKPVVQVQRVVNAVKISVTKLLEAVVELKTEKNKRTSGNVAALASQILYRPDFYSALKEIPLRARKVVLPVRKQPSSGTVVTVQLCGTTFCWLPHAKEVVKYTDLRIGTR